MMKTITSKSWKSIILAVAMLLIIAPMLVKADTVKLASPKDAKQTDADEKGFKVSWSAVTGAKSYVYSYSKDGKTFTTESPTGNGGADTFVGVLNDAIEAGTDYYVKVRAYDGTKYSEEVVVKVASAPKKPATLKQTAAEANSVTVAWDKSEGATGYLVRFGTTEATAKDYATVKTTSAQLKGLTPDTQYYIAVYPVRKVTNDYSAKYDCVKSFKLVTTADKVKGLKLTMWDLQSNLLEISWDNTAKYESGYQFQLFSADGEKMLKSYNVTGRRVKRAYFKNKSVATTPFIFRIRTFTTIGGQKFYGEWSDNSYAVPQAKLTAKKKSATSVQLSWSKVAGAKKYIVYMGKADNGKYKKVTTVKKTTCKVTGLAENTDYFFYVKAADVPMQGKKYSSNKVEVTNDINVYIDPSKENVTE